MRKPSGHIRPHGAGYQVAVPVGRGPITKRYRYTYEQASTLEQAQAVRQRLVGEVTSGRKPRTQATFGQLLDEVIKVTDLDPQTTYTYGGYIERTIRPALGTIPVHDLEERPELIDRLYAELRRCGKLCGGRRGLVDHRPAGRGKRLDDGTPDHERDARCRPHQCQPAAPSTVAQIHAIIKRTLGYGVRWKWLGENPALAAAGEHSYAMEVLTAITLSSVSMVIHMYSRTACDRRRSCASR